MRTVADGVFKFWLSIHSKHNVVLAANNFPILQSKTTVLALQLSVCVPRQHVLRRIFARPTSTATPHYLLVGIYNTIFHCSPAFFIATFYTITEYSLDKPNTIVDSPLSDLKSTVLALHLSVCVLRQHGLRLTPHVRHRYIPNAPTRHTNLPNLLGGSIFFHEGFSVLLGRFLLLVLRMWKHLWSFCLAFVVCPTDLPTTGEVFEKCLFHATFPNPIVASPREHKKVRYPRLIDLRPRLA